MFCSDPLLDILKSGLKVSETRVGVLLTIIKYTKKYG